MSNPVGIACTQHLIMRPVPACLPAVSVAAVVS
uniref:Uncharacterized protein n=1 Tax=Arundo donax TaxID=35708 RepID=A0A0A9ADU9_ARUDO